MSELDIVTVRLQFDAIVLTASFLNDTAAADWIGSTLHGLLLRHPLTVASQIEIRRV